MGHDWNWHREEVCMPKSHAPSDHPIPDTFGTGLGRNDAMLLRVPEVVSEIPWSKNDRQQNQTGAIRFAVTNDESADYGTGYLGMVSNGVPLYSTDDSEL